MDPITLNRLALIRQQELLQQAAFDRQNQPFWRAFWRTLTSRRSASVQPTQAERTSAHTVNSHA